MFRKAIEDNKVFLLLGRDLLDVLVVVLLSLVDLLSKAGLVVDQTLQFRKRNRLEEHTSKLTPQLLIVGEHGHDAGIDGLTKALLLGFRISSRSGLGLHRRLRLLRLHLDGLLHGDLLLVGTTTLVGAVVEGTLVLRLTRIRHVGTLDVGTVHVGREADVAKVGREHLLTIHAAHARRDHAALLVALRLEHGVTIGLPLSKSNIKGLAVENVAHNLLDGLRSRLGGSEIAETEALAGFIGVPHDDGALDHTVVLEEVAKILVGDRIGKVTDVDVGLGSGLVVEVTLVPLRSLTLVLLLGAIDVHLKNGETVLLELLLILTLFDGANKRIILPLESLAVHGFLCFNSISVVLKVDKTEAAALTLFVGHDDGRSDLTELREHLQEIISGEVLADVLHVDVGESLVGVVGTEVLGDEFLDNKLFTESAELLFVGLAGLESLERVFHLIKLDETIAKAGAIILGDNLARRNGTKVREDILKLNESDTLVKRLDKQVAFIALTLRRITTRPHDTARLTL